MAPVRSKQARGDGVGAGRPGDEDVEDRGDVRGPRVDGVGITHDEDRDRRGARGRDGARQRGLRAWQLEACEVLLLVHRLQTRAQRQNDNIRALRRGDGVRNQGLGRRREVLDARCVEHGRGLRGRTNFKRCP